MAPPPARERTPPAIHLINGDRQLCTPTLARKSGKAAPYFQQPQNTRFYKKTASTTAESDTAAAVNSLTSLLTITRVAPMLTCITEISQSNTWESVQVAQSLLKIGSANKSRMAHKSATLVRCRHYRQVKKCSVESTISLQKIWQLLRTQRQV